MVDKAIEHIYGNALQTSSTKMGDQAEALAVMHPPLGGLDQVDNFVGLAISRTQ